MLISTEHRKVSHSSEPAYLLYGAYTVVGTKILERKNASKMNFFPNRVGDYYNFSHINIVLHD